MIDIIIPVYKSHETIHATLASLVSQKLSSLLDVYLINDGDTQGYEEIVEMYQKTNRLNSIQVINLDKNEGPGNARNVGIVESEKRTNNPWILFIDSDDYCSSPYSINYFFIETQKSPNASIIETKCAYEHNPLTFVRAEEWTPYFFYFLDIRTLGYCAFHGKLYSRKFLKKWNLKIPCTRSNEDSAFHLPIYSLKEKEIIVTDWETMCINCNEKSITRNFENSTRALFVGNANVLADWYAANFEVSQKIKLTLSEKNKKLLGWQYIFDFIYKYDLLFSEESDSFWETEQGKLYLMYMYLYYRDIILSYLSPEEVLQEIYKINEREDLDTNWKNPEEFIQRITKAYNRQEFISLREKYITDKGYHHD